MTKVLISGASIAGPALAYWLTRAGFEVTVVEKAGALRGGGYPIDIRGSALEVARRMGILPRLREAHVDVRRLTFFDEDGGRLASVRPAARGEDLEVRRGDLAESLYALVRDDVEFLFGDSIDEIGESGEVTFRSGSERAFDLVIGADGTHSRTREAVFGSEESFHHYLGYCFAIFTTPNTWGLSREILMWNAPGRAAALYATRDELHGFFTFHRPRPPAGVLRNPAAQRELVAETFAGAGWEIPRLVTAMEHADDLFFDTVGQIRMPAWSRGRVALVGDAAYTPSFLTGQGSSLALSGAYVLAHSLATHPGHAAAFAAYERDMRGYVAANQALVDHGAALFPITREALAERNGVLRGLTAMPESAAQPAYSALVLPPEASPVR